MTSIYDAFGANKSFEKDGITVDYGPAGKFILARAGGSNKKFAKVLEARYRPYRRQAEAGTLDNEVAERLMAEAYAEAVVLGWEGVTDRNGDPIPFSRDTCISLLLELPDLFSEIREQAGQFANYRILENEEDLGN